MFWLCFFKIFCRNKYFELGVLLLKQDAQSVMYCDVKLLGEEQNKFFLVSDNETLWSLELKQIVGYVIRDLIGLFVFDNQFIV